MDVVPPFWQIQGFSKVSQNVNRKNFNQSETDIDPMTSVSLKPQPNALDFSLYIARQMSSIVECCRERVAKRSRLFTRLGTQHSIDVLFE